MKRSQAIWFGGVTGFILAVKGNMKAIGAIALGCAMIYIVVKQYCLQDKQFKDENWIGQHLEQKQQQIDQLKSDHD
jgi:hypothetical protein